MVKRYLIICFVLLFLIASCSMLQTRPDLSPKEKGIIMLSAYRFEYEDYTKQAARRDLTEPEKEVLRVKKSILVQVYPLINLYKQYVDEGQTAAVLNQLEFRISDLFNQVGSAIIKKLMTGGESWRTKTTRYRVYSLQEGSRSSRYSFKLFSELNG